MESLTTMQIVLLLGFAGCLARRIALYAVARTDPNSETINAQTCIFQALTNLGFILGYVYVSEHTSLFARAPRLFHMPTYLISHVVFYGAVLLYPLKSVIVRNVKGTMRDLRGGGGTTERADEHELQALASGDSYDKSSPPTSSDQPAAVAKFEVPMGRAQTEEWKGWMQFEFVAYHIFAASSTYNSIRCYVSAYVWLTGFGNFTFFVSKGDYSAMRVGKMLWRLLFFCALLCLVTNNNIFLYYIVPLHTFYFLVTYVVCGVWRAGNSSHHVLIAKLAILAAAIYALWDGAPAGFDALFGTLFPLLGINPTWVYEWHFRTYLDHYSAVLGMCFAFKFPNYVQWVKDVEAKAYGTQLLLKSLVWLFLSAALIVWGVFVFSKPKYEYNSYAPPFPATSSQDLPSRICAGTRSPQVPSVLHGDPDPLHDLHAEPHAVAAHPLVRPAFGDGQDHARDLPAPGTSSPSSAARVPLSTLEYLARPTSTGSCPNTRTTPPLIGPTLRRPPPTAVLTVSADRRAPSTRRA
jgi:hypothetical protein